MNKTLIVTIVLGILIVLAVAQTVQIYGIKTKVSSGDLGKVSSATQTINTQAPSQPQAPVSSGMVGGC